MARDIRVPLAFAPPRGWEIGDPDAVGVSEAAFVARFPVGDRGFHATIQVRDVEFTPGEDLASVARRSRLEPAEGRRVELLDATAGAPREVSSYRQLLQVEASVGGEPRDLVQQQVFLDVDDPRSGFRAIVLLVLTATRAQHEQVRPTFAAFVRSISADWA